MRTCLPFTVILLSATFARAHFTADEDARDRFLKAYEPELAILVDQYVKNRHITIIEKQFTRNGEELSQNEIQLLSNETSIRFRRQYLRGKAIPMSPSGQTAKEMTEPGTQPSTSSAPNTRVPKWAVFRPDAYYQIEGKRGASGVYVLSGLGTGGTIMTAGTRYGVAQAFVPLNGVNGSSFPERIRQSGSQVLSFGKSEWRGRQLTRLQWSLTDSRNTATTSSYFDPENHWVSCGEESEVTNDKTKYVTVVEYAPARDGVAPITKVQEFREYPGRAPWLEDQFDYTEFERAHPDASEFSLAQFGLSDPKPPTEPPVLPGLGLHIWLIGAGLLTAAVAIAMYTFATRKPKTAKAT